MNRTAIASFTVGVGMLLALAFLAASLFFGASVQAQTERGNGAGNIIPGRFIVALDEEVSPRQVATDMSRRYDIQVDHVYDEVVNGFAGSISEGHLSEVRADGRVRKVTPDREVEAFAASQEPVRPESAAVPYGVDRIDAENSGTISDVGVAVIDTGIDLDHKDLNVSPTGKNCMSSALPDDDHGHGSHVAGTIGAKAGDNNGDGTPDGVVGVAPGAPLSAVKVLNSSGSGSTSSIICGINWVTANASSIKVANMSLGGSGLEGSCTDGSMHQAICQSQAKGVTYVVAAGNSNANLANFAPARYNDVLTVTAMADSNGSPNMGGTWQARCRTEQEDTRADFSNYTYVGNADQYHTIAAPGVCIESTWMNGQYNTLSGTSMASPHVAGAAALCIKSKVCDNNRNGTITPSEVRTKLRSDAESKTKGGNWYGFKEDRYRVTSTGSRYFGYLVYAGGYKAST